MNVSLAMFIYFRYKYIFANLNTLQTSHYTELEMSCPCNSLNTGHAQKNGAVSEVDKNEFLSLHGHNLHCQQRELSKFLMRYQQFAPHAYCGAAGPVSKRCPDVITMQSEFVNILKKKCTTRE
jgi:hypothetical protein